MSSSPDLSQHAVLSARALGRIAQPRFRGELGQEQAQARACTLITTEHGAQQSPEHIELMLLVDPAGTIVDVRYRTAARDAQLAAYDVMAELCVGKTFQDGASITPRQVDTQLRDAGGGPVLEQVATNHPDADRPFYVLGKAAQRYIGGQAVHVAPAKPAAAAGSYANDLPWPEVGLFEKVRRIEAVLDTQVRPALAQDGGGLDLIDLKGDDLYVQYQGACGSCSSSIGGTMQFITDALNNSLGTRLSIKVGGTEAPEGSMVGL